MLQKARHWTKAVEYVEETIVEHTAHAHDEGGDYSKQANIKKRIVGLNAPSWSDAAGPGNYEYELAPTAPPPPCVSGAHV